MLDNKELIYIFLDFDGVLHKSGGYIFENAKYLAKALDNYNIKIVFSTSWRENSTVKHLSSHLPLVLHEKCIGMTPIIEQNIPYKRYYEILKYIEVNKIEDQWIAIDDMKHLFRKDCAELFLVNGSEGFQKKYISQLQEKLNRMQNNDLISASKSKMKKYFN